MPKPLLFTGCACAMTTPFVSGGEVDFDALRRHTDVLLENGIDALVVCGTTGEPPTLTDRERGDILRAVCRQAKGKVPVIAGVGGNNTRKVIENCREAGDIGADGVLAVTPYYNKTSQRGLEKHYCAIMDASPLPVILYNVPARCGYSIEKEALEGLKNHPRAAGLKEASGDYRRWSMLLASFSEDLALYAGDDEATLPFVFTGAQGVISVAANALPKEMTALCRACLAGDKIEAARRHFELYPFFRALSQDVNPIPIKAALKLLGLCDGSLRLPLLPMEEEKIPGMQKALRGLGKL